MLVTIAEPVRHNGKLVGVVGADALSIIVNDVISLDVGDNANAMLIDARYRKNNHSPDSALSLKPVSQLSK
ncbi:hypothetical protein O9929_20245 [Vibrio lentus]|nr:hypothetical protein [Vibrio lentus]